MDQENIPLNLLSESQEGEKRPPRLRISSETENNTTNTTNDTSQDTSHDKSQDISHDKSKDNIATGFISVILLFIFLHRNFLFYVEI